jgi:hypothetical protein
MSASGAQATIPSEPAIAPAPKAHSNKRLLLWIALAASTILIISGFLYYFNRPHTIKDDFSADKTLDPVRWQVGTSLLTSLAQAQGLRYVDPQLNFDHLGMRMAGVNGTYEFTGVQSTNSLSPPLKVRVKVMGTVSHGRTFAFYLLSNDLRQPLAIEGNLNPQSGYQGLSIGTVKVLRDVETNQWYTVVVVVDARGSATVTFSDSRDMVLASKSGLQLGLGPFFIVLGQAEGAPVTVGSNEAVWSFAEVTSGSNSVASGSNENAVSDAAIVRNIKAAFFNDETLRKSAIEVTAQNGIVTLIGVVNTDSDKSNAVRIANQQQGVRQIVDQLVLAEVSPTASKPEPRYAGTWLGFANETSPQDREVELHQSCKADFRRVYVPLESGNRFTDLCRSVGKTCERVCDWQGNIISCSAVSQGGNRDGSRIALCR